MAIQPSRLKLPIGGRSKSVRRVPLEVLIEVKRVKPGALQMDVGGCRVKSNR